MATAQETLQQYFGYPQLHPSQEQAIGSVMAGRDTFVLMPTGGGKSMCYQIPALMLEGTTIVVSPLIALMKDQVDSLQANGVAAYYLNSSLELKEQNQIKDKLLAGEIQILYVSAERLTSPDFLKLLQQITPNLFAIDEAHCISAWGHDFRPDYTQLSVLRKHFPQVSIIALTATADQVTRQDIMAQLEMDQPQQIVDSFDRPNISLSVLPGVKRTEKIKNFLQDKQSQSGIIYCLTRKQTEKVAEKLQSMGLSAASYHAGLSSAARSRIQKSFVQDRTLIICATIAFGMGIDKSNVRWVIHYNLPKNIEGYYQELGRAGRDSAPAEALLFYSYADVEMIKQFFLDKNQGQLQLAKLERMKEYAEAVSCRRQVLLGYFDEEYDQACGNCDICNDPYPTKNGTQLVKTALRTLVELEQPTTQELVKALLPQSDKISYAEWFFYLAQLKNRGWMVVDFEHHGRLRLSPRGQKLLKSKQKIEMVALIDFIARQEKLSKSTKTKARVKRAKKDYYGNPLFEKLRQLRSELAQEHSLAAYMIFSDATLLEMVDKKPATKEEMLAISGVGQVKWERYGEAFLGVISG